MRDRGCSKSERIIDQDIAAAMKAEEAKCFT